MIRKSISKSKGFAALSPPAAVLFTLLIPHYNTWGKLDGDPMLVKSIVCPRVPYLTLESIANCLCEISAKTNVKWYEVDGLHYLQCLNWAQHQHLRADRRGADELPNYSQVSPGLAANIGQVQDQSATKGTDSDGDVERERIVKSGPTATCSPSAVASGPSTNPPGKTPDVRHNPPGKPSSCPPPGGVGRYLHILRRKRALFHRLYGNDQAFDQWFEMETNEPWQDSDTPPAALKHAFESISPPFPADISAAEPGGRARHEAQSAEAAEKARQEATRRAAATARAQSDSLLPTPVSDILLKVERQSPSGAASDPSPPRAVPPTRAVPPIHPVLGIPYRKDSP